MLRNSNTTGARKPSKLTQRSRTHVNAKREQKINGQTGTRKSLLHKRKCPCCKVWFRPIRDSHVYCTAKCRKRAWAVKTRETEREEPILVQATCAHCGIGFLRRMSGKKIYCSASCRVLASRIKREVTIMEFMAHKMQTRKEAEDIANTKKGYLAIQKYLTKRGLSYKPQRRQWVANVTAAPAFVSLAGGYGDGTTNS